MSQKKPVRMLPFYLVLSVFFSHASVVIAQTPETPVQQSSVFQSLQSEMTTYLGGSPSDPQVARRRQAVIQYINSRENLNFLRERARTVRNQSARNVDMYRTNSLVMLLTSALGSNVDTASLTEEESERLIDQLSGYLYPEMAPAATPDESIDLPGDGRTPVANATPAAAPVTGVNTPAPTPTAAPATAQVNETVPATTAVVVPATAVAPANDTPSAAVTPAAASPVNTATVTTPAPAAASTAATPAAAVNPPQQLRARDLLVGAGIGSTNGGMGALLTTSLRSGRSGQTLNSGTRVAREYGLHIDAILNGAFEYLNAQGTLRTSSQAVSNNDLRNALNAIFGNRARYGININAIRNAANGLNFGALADAVVERCTEIRRHQSLAFQFCGSIGPRVGAVFTNNGVDPAFGAVAEGHGEFVWSPSELVHLRAAVQGSAQVGSLTGVGIQLRTEVEFCPRGWSTTPVIGGQVGQIYTQGVGLENQAVPFLGVYAGLNFGEQSENQRCRNRVRGDAQNDATAARIPATANAESNLNPSTTTQEAPLRSIGTPVQH